jgi:ribose-phosphate pyrophosphokinase
MRPLILPMPGNEAMARAIATLAGGDVGAIEARRFPDQESHVRIVADVAGRDVSIVCTLVEPDANFLALCFAAGAARDLGAGSVRLIAPYLAYLRQDARFQPGEAISAKHFAALVSTVFDSLITVDPHLHRIKSLSDIYAVPAQAVSAASAIAGWIKRNVADPVIVGPDQESLQWVAEIGAQTGAPYVVLAKRRLGDREVEIASPDLSAFAGRQIVIVDDVIASGRTMIEAAKLVRAQGFAKPCCVAVHAVFAGSAYEDLRQEASAVVSTDTAPHASNAISVAGVIAQALSGAE